MPPRAVPDPPDASPSTLRAAARGAILEAWRRAAASGALPAGPDDGPEPSQVEIERPANAEHGDLATNLALRLAKPLRMAPPAIAAALAAELSTAVARGEAGPVASAEVAGPGFLNLRLEDGAIGRFLERARAEPRAWGRAVAEPAGQPAGERVNVEFVSANPTGPLTIGNARGAFVGDLLCRLLEAGGKTVTREYYFNDAGGQIDKLGASVLALRLGEPVPEDGYHGDYVGDLARAVPESVLAVAAAPDADGAAILGHWAAGVVREGIEASLERLGVHFDVWKTEASLHDEGWVGRAVERLRAAGHLYDQDGALWFRSTALGDDKDRVVIRSNGEPTYFAADIGYLAEKFSRGFDRIIYIWGIDHHGYVARTKAAAEALGIDRSRVEMLLTGWVSILRGSEVVAMSKRKGDIYRLDSLLDDVGPDAARWFFASRGANLDIDVDIELARRQSADNPVYYVQYAHARIASIVRRAAEAGLEAAPTLGDEIRGPEEAALARVTARFPEVVEDAAAAKETQGVTTYATELATAFHAFYRDARVVDAAEPARSAARLALVDATRITLAAALGLLGISAPDAM